MIHNDDDKLKSIELELIDLVKRKTNADRQLADIESRLYAFESSYLDDSTSAGNILRGFDNLVQARPERRQRKLIADADRIFSSSSTTLQQSLDLLAQSQDQTSGPNTPSATSRRYGDRAMSAAPTLVSLKKRTHSAVGTAGSTNYAHMHAFGLNSSGSASVPSTPMTSSTGHKHRTRTSERPQKKARILYNDEFET